MLSCCHLVSLSAIEPDPNIVQTDSTLQPRSSPQVSNQINQSKHTIIPKVNSIISDMPSHRSTPSKIKHGQPQLAGRGTHRASYIAWRRQWSALECAATSTPSGITQATPCGSAAEGFLDLLGSPALVRLTHVRRRLDGRDELEDQVG